MTPQVPENKSVMIGQGTVRAEDGPITFTSMVSLRLYVEDACRKEAAAAYGKGFRMGLIAAGLLGLAVAIFRMIWI